MALVERITPQLRMKYGQFPSENELLTFKQCAHERVQTLLSFLRQLVHSVLSIRIVWIDGLHLE